MHLRRSIHAHGMRLRMRRCKPDEVTPSGTAHFEHAGAGYSGKFQPEQMGHRASCPGADCGETNLRCTADHVVVGADLVNRVVQLVGGMRLVSWMSHGRSLVRVSTTGRPRRTSGGGSRLTWTWSAVVNIRSQPLHGHTGR